jgi:hypothetical protein
MFREDLARSAEIKEHRWLKRPAFQRLRERVAALFRPQL